MADLEPEPMTRLYQHDPVPVPPQKFVGQEELVKRLYKDIARKHCISLRGTLLSGKSSLLNYIASVEGQRCVPANCNLQRYLLIPINLQTYRQKRRDDFFQEVYQLIAKRLDELGEPGEKSIGKGYVGLKRPQDLFEDILKQAMVQRYRPVLLLDAFDNVTLNDQFDLEFFDLLRAKAIKDQVSYVTASVAPLNEVCHYSIRSSPFFDIFHFYDLGPLALSEARSLIAQRASGTAYPFKEEEIAWILNYAGRHPFFIEVLCYTIFKKKMQESRQVIDLEPLIAEVYNGLQPYFSAIWQKLSDRQKVQLTTQYQHPELKELSESRLFCQFVSQHK